MPFTDPDTLTRWAQLLARFPSPQTDAFEAEPQVQAYLAGPVVAILDECGLPWRRDAMGNVIVEVGTEGPPLMLMGYAMTHPANRMRNAFCGTLANGRIRGRGMAEQKGALVAAIAAAAEAGDRRVTLAITAAGETGRHDAARSVLASMDHMPVAAIIVIGTSGRLALSNKGRIDVEVRIKGRAAHSSTPEAGINAITGAQGVLDRVLALDVGTRAHPLGLATLVATSIRSWPEATHTIQDEVRIVFDRRLLPGDDADDAFAAIASAAQGGDCHIETLRGPHMFPAEIAPDGKLASAIAADTFHSSGALDAGLFCAKRREAAMWGPGDMTLWHSDEESIAVEEIREGALGYLGLIRAYR